MLANLKNWQYIAYSDRMGKWFSINRRWLEVQGPGLNANNRKSNCSYFTNYYQSHFNGNEDFVPNPSAIIAQQKTSVIGALWFSNENVIEEVKNSDGSKESFKKSTDIIRGAPNLG